MGSISLLVALLTAACSAAITGTTANQLDLPQDAPIESYFEPGIKLSKIITQVVFYFPVETDVFDYEAGNPAGLNKCHLISFEDRNGSSEYGISVRVHNAYIQGSDTIEVSTNSTTSASASSGPVVWGSSNATSAKFEIENDTICIRLKGVWTSSNATIIASVYYPKSTPEDACPPQTNVCPCKTNGLSDNQCLPLDQFCNGFSNCGCDVNGKSCQKSYKYPDNICDDICAWNNFEYMLMMITTGLLFLLIPIAFVVIMMYHRKYAAAGRMMNGEPCTYRQYDRNNNVEHCGHPHHVISTVPVHLDQPPSYDDLPDEVKVRPGQESYN